MAVGSVHGGGSDWGSIVEGATPAVAEAERLKASLGGRI